MALPPPNPSSTAVITGASSGIGEEFARQLAARGHGVFLVARREERLRKLAEEIAARSWRARRGGGVRPRRTPPTGRSCLAWSPSRGSTSDILVNNAGFTTVGDVHANPDRQLGMMRVNVEALVDLTTMWLPGMVERGRGAVIQVASTAAFQPIPVQATYAATKAFVLSFTEATSAELKGTGVTMTALCPGPVGDGVHRGRRLQGREAGPVVRLVRGGGRRQGRHRGRREGQARRDPGHRQPRRSQASAATARGRSCSARSPARTAGRSASSGKMHQSPSVRWACGPRTAPDPAGGGSPPA